MNLGHYESHLQELTPDDPQIANKFDINIRIQTNVVPDKAGHSVLGAGS